MVATDALSLALALEAATLLLCASVTTAFFAWRALRGGSARRRWSAVALLCVSVGHLAQGATLLSARADGALAVASAPACLGQALLARLLLRQLADGGPHR
jgi:uncharacterized membrane protein